MTQLTINIEDQSILPHLKKILNSLKGVSVAKTARNNKPGIERAFEDIEAGRVNHYNSAADMYKALGI